MDEPDARQMREDLAFVKDAVQRRRRLGAADLALNVMWGLITMVGLALCDVRPRWVLWYWPIAGGAGWAVSFLVGWWAWRRRGEADGPRSRRELLHWIALTGTMVVLFFVGIRSGYHGWQIGQMALLVGGLAFLLAGVHLDESWFPPGCVLLAGAMASVFLMGHYTWTIVGVAVFASLTAGSLLRARKHEQRRQTT